MSKEKEKATTKRVRVVDAAGKPLSSTTPERAAKLIASGRAVALGAPAFTIQLTTTVDFAPRAPEPEPDWTGTRILLHACCAPCTTYTQKRLREQGFAVTGFWYNPNIYPRREHALRRAAMEQFVDIVKLPVIWELEGEAWAEENRRWQAEVKRGKSINVPDRCAVCYRIRLTRAAAAAAARGFSHFTTTLLISPYQRRELICEVGAAASAEYGVSFYYENFRRGYAESRRLTKEYGLYSQKYCGCVYSRVVAQ